MSKMLSIAAIIAVVLTSMIGPSFALNPQPLPPGYAAPPH